MKNLVAAILILITAPLATAQTETRPLDSFTKIVVDGAGKIYLTEGSSNEVRIRINSDRYGLEDIVTNVRGNTLKIDYRNKTWASAPKVDFWITYKDLEAIEVNGAVTLNTETPIIADKFKLDCSGAETATLELDVNTLEAYLSGAGTFHLSGRADTQTLDLSGAGKINAEDLKGKDVVADVSGVGAMRVYATESIDGNVSGIGKIRFKGNPKIQKLNSDGLGSVKPMD